MNYFRLLGVKHYKYSLVLLVFLVSSKLISAQEPSTNAAMMVQPCRLVIAHSAGVLKKGGYDIEARIYPNGTTDVAGSGVQMGVSVGLTNRLNIGLSYGADGLIGRGRAVRPNPYPGAFIKYRLFEEDFFIPAIALGYDHQGHGGIQNGDYAGFIYKSPGFFLALSKNYLLFSKVQLGLHGAITFSMEEIHYVKWPNGYLGIDLGLNEELALVAEYNMALNDRDLTQHYANPFYGYLNCGIRWAVTPQFRIEFDALDILENKMIGTHRLGWGRELKFVYVNNF